MPYTFSLVGAIANAVNVTSYGAIGDGVTNNQLALTTCAAANAGNGKFIYFPPGTYLYSSNITFQNVIFGAGNDLSILKAINTANSTIFISGTNVGAGNITFDGSGTTRLSADNSAGLYFNGATSYMAKNVHVKNSPSVGIWNKNSSSDGVVTNCYLEHNYADSIATYHGANNITVQNNYVYQSGDDGISVVSFNDNPPLCRNIVIVGNRITDNIFARGIAVVGGENVSIERNYIKNVTTNAGIYINTESAYNTKNTTDVLIQGNVLNNCGSEGTFQAPIAIINEGGKSGIQLVNEIKCIANSIYKPNFQSGINVISYVQVCAFIKDNNIYSNSSVALRNDNPSGNGYILTSNNNVLPENQFGMTIPPNYGIDTSWVTS